LLSRLSIRAKLSAALGTLLLLLLLVAGIGGAGLMRVDSEAEEIRLNWLPGVARVAEFRVAVTRLRQMEGHYLLMANEAERARERSEIRAARQHMESVWTTYRTLISDAEEEVLARRVEAATRSYLLVHERILAAGEASDRAAAARFYAEETRPAFRALYDVIGELMAMNGRGADAATQRVSETYRLAIFGLGVLTLVALGIALGTWLLLDRGVARPLARMTTRIGTLAAGELASPIEGTARRDELGSMAQAMETFRARLAEQAKLDAAVKAEHAARQARTERVEGLVRDFEVETAELLRSMTSGAGELDTTAHAMQSTARDGEARAASLASAAGQASANVQTVAASAEEMAASIAEVSRQVAESARVARQAAEDARSTDAAVATLAEAASRIGEVVRLISGIASQTNLLALNATIEAARAGEAGKGFAVVASEVKQLATQTTRATEEIGAQIAAMQAETTRAVDAIRGIARTIEGMDGLTTQVAAAAEQQSAAVQEIGRAVAEAAAGTAEVSRNASGVTDGAQETGRAAGQVGAASAALSRSAELLRGQVDGFLAGIRAA